MSVIRTLDLTIIIKEEDLDDMMIMMAPSIEIISKFKAYNETLGAFAVSIHVAGFKSDILNLVDWLEQEYPDTAIVAE